MKYCKLKFSRLCMFDAKCTVYDYFCVSFIITTINTDSKYHMLTNPWRLKRNNSVKISVRWPSSKDAAMQEHPKLWWWRRPFETQAGFLFWLWLIGNLFCGCGLVGVEGEGKRRGQKLIVIHFHTSTFGSWFCPDKAFWKHVCAF